MFLSKYLFFVWPGDKCTLQYSTILRMVQIICKSTVLNKILYCALVYTNTTHYIQLYCTVLYNLYCTTTSHTARCRVMWYNWCWTWCLTCNVANEQHFKQCMALEEAVVQPCTAGRVGAALMPAREHVIHQECRSTSHCHPFWRDRF